MVLHLYFTPPVHNLYLVKTNIFWRNFTNATHVQKYFRIVESQLITLAEGFLHDILKDMRKRNIEFTSDPYLENEIQTGIFCMCTWNKTWIVKLWGNVLNFKVAWYSLRYRTRLLYLKDNFKGHMNSGRCMNDAAVCCCWYYLSVMYMYTHNFTDFTQPLPVTIVYLIKLFLRCYVNKPIDIRNKDVCD